MNIDKLKGKVLQLAIQGKLVPQNEEDIPASVLLEEIIKEKEQLVKEKKIKKEKPLQEITEEEKLFKLPNGWEWCRLGTVGYTNIGLTYKPKDVGNDGTPVLRSTNIQNGKIDLNDLVRVQVDIPENKMCEIGDILICARNGSKRLVGKCAIIKETGMSFGAFMAIYRSKYNEYINIILNSEFFKKQLGDSNTVTINQITQSMLKNIVCPLPPLEEQKRIVEKVEGLFSIIDNLNKNKEEMLKNISNTRNKVLQLAIQGKLVEQNENDTPASVLLEEIKKEKEELMKEKKIKKEKALPEITEEEKFFELPKGWGWCKLGEIGYTNIGLTYNPKDIVEVGIPVLRSTNIQNSKIDLNDLVCVQTDIPENKMCKIGDILICARNGSKHLVGKCAIIKENGMSFGAFMAIYRSKYNEYINIILNSELFKKQLGDSNTVTIKQITQTMLRNIVCPLPPLEEQKRIVSKVDEIMDYLDELEKVIL